MTSSPSDSFEETPPRSQTDRLLDPLTETQQWVVDIIGQAFWNQGFTWPTFLYVEAEMDRRGHDLREVLATFPLIGDPQGQRYGALTALPHVTSMNESRELKLSLLGVWQCGTALRLTARAAVADFFNLLNRFVIARRAWMPEPNETTKPEITSEEVLANQRQRLFSGMETSRSSPQWARLLYQLMDEEQCFSGGHSADVTLTDWKWTVERTVLQYRDVASIEQYVERLAEVLTPPKREHRTITSPLDLPTSLGYLNSAWRLSHDRAHLLHLVSPEKTASLTYDVGSREEFFDRLSALCDTLKGFQVPGGTLEGGHPVVRLKGHLHEILSSESHGRVDEALETLGSLIAIRNGSEHGDAQDRAAASWLALGVRLPVADWSAAWVLVRQKAIIAFDVLRDELIALSD